MLFILDIFGLNGFFNSVKPRTGTDIPLRSVEKQMEALREMHEERVRREVESLEHVDAKDGSGPKIRLRFRRYY